MDHVDLISAVQADDLQAVRGLLDAKVDVNKQDQQGWTALHYASGKGDLNLVKLLVENGADVLVRGGDQRTPYSIALAAGRADVARYLREVEDASAPENTPRPPRKYCKAYYLRDLRKYAGWNESRINWKSDREVDLEGKALADESIVFIHQDHTVTRSMWPDEDVIFNEAGPEWEAFCARALGFRVPDDLDLIASATTA